MAREYSISKVRMLEILQETKCVYDDIDFSHEPGSDYIHFRANQVFRLDTGATIPGASVVFRSVRTPGFVRHSLDLRIRHLNVENIVLQIEVLPFDIQHPTHREPGLTLHGSHLLKATQTIGYDRNTDNWTWFQWLSEFERQTNLQCYGNKYEPFIGELF